MVYQKLHYPIIPASLVSFMKSRKGGKEFYMILNKNEDKPTSQQKWETIYYIEKETWKNIYDAPFQLFISTKLQWFQIRINHRILPTRKYLYNIKQIPSPLCNQCKEEESVSHMLWSCHESQSLIGQFTRWLNSKNIILTLVEELFMFYIGNTYLLSDLQIIMFVKYYIYITKYLNNCH